MWKDQDWKLAGKCASRLRQKGSVQEKSLKIKNARQLVADAGFQLNMTCVLMCDLMCVYCLHNKE